MKPIRAIALAAVLLAPTANAQGQGGVETMFDETLAALCSSQGALTSIPIGGLNINIPGMSDFGLDIRPLCQYADIVSMGTSALKDLRDGTFRGTERLVNETLAAIAGALGGKVDTETANQAIQDLDDTLQAALDAPEGFLSAYQEATSGVVEQLTQVAKDHLENEYDAARAAMTAPDAEPATSQALAGIAPVAGLRSDIIDQRTTQLDQRLQSEALTTATEQLLEDQLSNNAYQQTVEDTLRVAVAPGEQGGVAQQIEQDAQASTSVRQSINVLAQAMAAQLRNEAVFSGALIENLQANARQQVVTNHQLSVLANSLLAEQEAELAMQELELTEALEEAHAETVATIDQLKTTINDAAEASSTEGVEQINFSYCGFYPQKCR